jgi:type III restriction enzyme
LGRPGRHGRRRHEEDPAPFAAPADPAPSPRDRARPDDPRRVGRAGQRPGRGPPDCGRLPRHAALSSRDSRCHRSVTISAAEQKLSREEKSEADRREKDARVWFSELKAIQGKIGLRGVYDLSATPFFLRGSGYPEGTLFPWVVSDFSLIDAIEAGIVKVPRVPVEDDQNPGAAPTYRDLWLSIRDDLPKKGRGTDAVTSEPKLPTQLQGALHSLYGNVSVQG